MAFSLKVYTHIWLDDFFSLLDIEPTVIHMLRILFTTELACLKIGFLECI